MKKLTENMVFVLRRAGAHGGVVAGQTVDRLGRIERNNPSVILALARRGLLKTKIGPDGGMAADLTEEGRDTLTLLDSGNGFLVSVGLGK